MYHQTDFSYEHSFYVRVPDYIARSEHEQEFKWGEITVIPAGKCQVLLCEGQAFVRGFRGSRRKNRTDC